LPKARAFGAKELAGHLDRPDVFLAQCFADVVPRRKWRAQTQACIGHLRSRLNQTLPDGVPYQAGGLMRVKFLHDSGPMRGEVAPMKPYYILMKLPGSDQLDYLLMTPFTPQKRDNMISWMAARSDFPDYGKMLFYQLLKEKLIYGPMQIETMINQNTTIAQQLTLWDQKGSKVIRGNLIAVPIENSFLYVVPLYLTAEGTDFPQLKRVIVISGDKVAMEPTLDEAIQSVFGIQQPENPTQASSRQPEFGQARTQFDEAQKAMQQGDWATFGKAMEALKRVLAGAAQ
jgi:uncharacterized membrane protein (UPF0182 family)